MYLLISLFSNQVQREDRQENRINGGKEKSRQRKLAKDAEGKTNRASEEREAQVARASTFGSTQACVWQTQKPNRKPSNCLTPRTGTFLPSSWFGRVLAYSIQFHWESLSILCKEQIVIFHLKHTRCTDLMSSVKLTHYHQLLVKGFQDVWACYHSVDCLLCVHNVSVYWTTDRQSLCHHWWSPPSGSATVTSPSTWLVIGLALSACLVFLEFMLQMLLRCFLMHLFFKFLFYIGLVDQ